jgi:hypothetical protein
VAVIHPTYYRIVPDDLDYGFAERVVICDRAEDLDVDGVGRQEDASEAQLGRGVKQTASQAQALHVAIGQMRCHQRENLEGQVDESARGHGLSALA